MVTLDLPGAVDGADATAARCPGGVLVAPGQGRTIAEVRRRTER